MSSLNKVNGATGDLIPILKEARFEIIEIVSGETDSSGRCNFPEDFWYYYVPLIYISANWANAPSGGKVTFYQGSSNNNIPGFEFTNWSDGSGIQSTFTKFRVLCYVSDTPIH